MVRYRVYKSKYVKNHPRFGTKTIGLHRFLIYEKYGESLPDCEICGLAVFWEKCHIDHIDNNPQNNNINNLRPLHIWCNVGRVGNCIGQKNIAGAKARNTPETFPYDVKSYGFINVEQAAHYSGVSSVTLRLIYRQDREAFTKIIGEAAEKKALDKGAKQFTAKQLYDIAMMNAGFVRIQGWVRPENKDKVQLLLETKGGKLTTNPESLAQGEPRVVPRCDFGGEFN